MDKYRSPFSYSQKVFVIFLTTFQKNCIFDTIKRIVKLY